MPAFNSSLTGNTSATSATADQYNFGPLNHYLRPDTRYSLGAMGHYELATFADVYTQLMFTDVRSVAQIAPGGIFFDTSTINCDNPFLSAQQATTIGCGAPARRATSRPGHGQPSWLIQRRAAVHRPSQRRRRRPSAGLPQHVVPRPARLARRRSPTAGRMTSACSSRARRPTQRTLNNFSIPKITARAGRGHGSDDGQYRVPLGGRRHGSGLRAVQLFAVGGVTPEALAYISAPGLQVGTIDQNVTQGVITGDLGTIGAQAAVGRRVHQGRVRRRKPPRQADEHAGRSAGAGAAVGLGRCDDRHLGLDQRERPVHGSERPAGAGQAVRRAAVVRHWPIATPTTARASRPTRTSSARTGRRWKTSASARSYQRAVRAPNIVELFTAQGFNLFDMDGDPCGADDPAPTAEGRRARPTRRECAATGARRLRLAGRSDSPAGQYQFRRAAHRAWSRRPRTRTPTASCSRRASRLACRVSVDYFDIEVEDLISTFGAEQHAGCVLRVQRRGGLLPHPSQPGERCAVARRWQRGRPQHQHRRSARPRVST